MSFAVTKFIFGDSVDPSTILLRIDMHLSIWFDITQSVIPRENYTGGNVLLRIFFFATGENWTKHAPSDVRFFCRFWGSDFSCFLTILRMFSLSLWELGPTLGQIILTFELDAIIWNVHNTHRSIFRDERILMTIKNLTCASQPEDEAKRGGTFELSWPKY